MELEDPQAAQPRIGAMVHKRVAIMQPYFFPYAGYYRLLAIADEFVIFDCVQWPRRGRVHRTWVPGPAGREEWLTLPLARQARDTLIRDLAFANDARAEFDRRLGRLPWTRQGTGAAATLVREYLEQPLASVINYLEDGLRLVRDLLDLKVAITRSSPLAVDPELRGQARVIEIAARLGATQYVNAPGGHSLYTPEAFTARGMELAFLAPYEGQFFHMLPSLMTDDLERIREDIVATTRLSPA